MVTGSSASGSSDRRQKSTDKGSDKKSSIGESGSETDTSSMVYPQTTNIQPTHVNLSSVPHGAMPGPPMHGKFIYLKISHQYC